MGLKPHDLVRLSSTQALLAADPPLWLESSLETTPWAVVRRAAPIGDLIPIGIRGAQRHERFAAHVDRSLIADIVTPADLVERKAWLSAERPGHPVVSGLADLAPLLEATGLSWGIAGGAGFELATGRPVLTDVSDLDLVVYAKAEPERSALSAFMHATHTAPFRVDVLVETPSGAVMLAELLSDADDLLLRTTAGPRLCGRAELLPAMS